MSLSALVRSSARICPGIRYHSLRLVSLAALLLLLISCQPPTAAPPICETDRFSTPGDYLPSPGFLHDIYTYPPSADFMAEWMENNPEATFPEVFSYCSYRTETEGAEAWLSCVQSSC